MIILFKIIFIKIKIYLFILDNNFIIIIFMFIYKINNYLQIIKIATHFSLQKIEKNFIKNSLLL